MVLARLSLRLAAAAGRNRALGRVTRAFSVAAPPSQRSGDDNDAPVDPKDILRPELPKLVPTQLPLDQELPGCVGMGLYCVYIWSD